MLPRLVVISNRVAVPDPAGKGSAGGLAVALREAFQSHGGLWIGWSGKVAAHPSPTPRFVDKDRVRYALLDLAPIDRDEYYSGFANRALWPNMHYRVGLSEFSRSDYAGYLRVNRTFANVVSTLIRPDDLIWVHDYHLIPLAAAAAPGPARGPVPAPDAPAVRPAPAPGCAPTRGAWPTARRSAAP